MRRLGFAVGLALALLSAPGGARDGQSGSIEGGKLFFVFFDWNSAELTRDAAAILDGVVKSYRSAGMVKVSVSGHSDRSGSSRDGVVISQRRADAVKAYLTDHGIPGQAIATSAWGERALLVETADGVREPQNRRVEIRLDDGSSE